MTLVGRRLELPQSGNVCYTPNKHSLVLNDHFIRLMSMQRFWETVQVIGNIVGTFVQHKLCNI